MTNYQVEYEEFPVERQVCVSGNGPSVTVLGKSLATIQVLVFCKVILGVISNNSTVFAGEAELSSSEFCVWLLESLQVSAILCDSAPQLQWLLSLL